MLTLTFLGVGSAFAKRNYQSNALVEAWPGGPRPRTAPADNLLIDFGGTGPVALHHLKGVPGFEYLGDGQTDYAAIRRVFVTHLHNDHVGGLEELAMMSRYFCVDPKSRRSHRPQLIGAAEVLDRLWENCLKGGLGAHRGGVAELADYFEILALRPGEPNGLDRFTLLGRYIFVPFATRHIEVRQPFDWPSYGLCVHDQTSGESILYSADTRFDYIGLREKLEQASVIFHEVQLEEQAEPVHTLLSELRTLPAEIRKKMWLYHYGDAWDSPAYSFVEREFAGFARPQVRYTLFGGAKSP